MKSNLGNTLHTADKQAEYDEHAKRILAQKIILAHILVNSVAEFYGMSPTDVVPLIEGEPQINETPLEPGMTNKSSKITGLNTEDSVPDEGTVIYDIRFFVWTPDKRNRVKIILDLEAQKKFHVGYPIVTRGIFYAARMISAQLDTEFTIPHYNNIKKVYSIWICMNSPAYAENTLTKYCMHMERLVGNYPDKKSHYDLINVVVIGLPKQLADITDELRLHRLLGTLFSSSLSYSAKKEILETEYNIPMDEEFERSVSEMCNLGEGIYEQGEEIGITKGKIEGKIEAYSNMIKKGKYSVEEAAEELGITIAEFNEKAMLISRNNN